jgi:hypothetical protein
MRNFNQIFIELDPLKRAAMFAASYTEDCLWIHPGGRIVGHEGGSCFINGSFFNIVQDNLTSYHRLTLKYASFGILSKSYNRDDRDGPATLKCHY